MKIPAELGYTSGITFGSLFGLLAENEPVFTSEKSV